MSETDGSRLKLWRTKKGLSQRDLASQLGRSQGFVGNIEADKTGLSRDLIARMAERTSVSVAWLLTGVGPMDVGDQDLGFAAGSGSSRVEPPQYARPLTGDFEISGTEFSMIKRFEITVSAGAGLLPIEGGEAENIAVSRDWLLSHGLGADLCGLVKVKGDSMVPTVPDGALVLVNASEMIVTNEGIFAFSRNGEAFIKRLVPVNFNDDGRAGSLVIISDNPAYPTETVTGEDLNEIRVVGRVHLMLSDL